MTDAGADNTPVILRDRRGQVEVLTLNRPEARNAVNGEVAKQMTAALDDLEKDEDLRVIVLTGAGDKAFCAGMDLKAFASGERRIHRRRHRAASPASPGVRSRCR